MPLTGLEHLLVLSEDVEASREFYCGALGFSEGERPPLEFPGYWLYLGGVPCVHLAEREAYERHSRAIGIPASPSASGTGAVDHLAFDGEDYDGLVARLERNGVGAATNTIPATGVRQLFIEDPNGVKIEINVKREQRSKRGGNG